MNRRDFIRKSAIAGVGLTMARGALAQAPASKLNDLQIAIVGTGKQGLVLLRDATKIPNVRFRAVCDIWGYSQTYASNFLEKSGQPVTVYSDYLEMLDKESDLDAVIVATPDFVHAPVTIAALKAGKHVYCEKEMSNSLEAARDMVTTARETGKLLQIGHQRRSNPRYQHALQMITKDKLLGRITHVQGQWNRSQRQEGGWSKKWEMSKEDLERYGYGTMERFRNWRNYKAFSGGPIADLGSHQIDIFNWFLSCPPSSVMATGGLDYYDTGEWYDNALALYDYKPAWGPVRGFYQVANTTSHNGYYETFMGDEGSLVISEDVTKGHIFRELTAKRREWEDEADLVSTMGREAIELKIGESRSKMGGNKEGEELGEGTTEKAIHQLHLENFLDAIRNGTPLTCPGEVGYETAVTVLRVNDAIEARRALDFAPEDFHV
jgi:predicted dehydrogenase